MMNGEWRMANGEWLSSARANADAGGSSRRVFQFTIRCSSFDIRAKERA